MIALALMLAAPEEGNAASALDIIFPKIRFRDAFSQRKLKKTMTAHLKRSLNAGRKNNDKTKA